MAASENVEEAFPVADVMKPTLIAPCAPPAVLPAALPVLPAVEALVDPVDPLLDALLLELLEHPATSRATTASPSRTDRMPMRRRASLFFAPTVTF
jgi:hypothetical protein